jgi:hypothetical protein
MVDLMTAFTPKESMLTHSNFCARCWSTKYDSGAHCAVHKTWQNKEMSWKFNVAETNSLILGSDNSNKYEVALTCQHHQSVMPPLGNWPGYM